MSEGTSPGVATGTGQDDDGVSPSSWRNQPPGMVLHLVLVIALAVALGLLSSPRTSGLAAPAWAVLVVVPVVVVWLVRLFAFVSSRRGRSARPVWRGLAVVPLMLAIAMAAWGLELPLRARFAVSEPALVRARDRALARPDGYRYHHGRIGLYPVQAIDAEDGNVSFTIGGDETADHSYAFVCLTRSGARTRRARPEFADAHHLAGCWYLTVESTD